MDCANKKMTNENENKNKNEKPKNIRRIEETKCYSCGGWGYRENDRCRSCSGTGYLKDRFDD